MFYEPLQRKWSLKKPVCCVVKSRGTEALKRLLAFQFTSFIFDTSLWEKSFINGIS